MQREGQEDEVSTLPRELQSMREEGRVERDIT